MPLRTNAVANRRQRPRHRMRPAVEVLDARRLLAAGVTATPIPTGGTAGIPLHAIELTYISPPGGGITESQLVPAPAGTPIPLTVLSNPTGALPATGYTGTVDWGDGTATDAAVFGTFSYVPDSYLFNPLTPDAGTLTVNAPDHTYAAAGTYPITVAVTGPGDATPTVIHDTATVAAAPTITGQVNNANGFFEIFGTSTSNTLNTSGTTQPGSTVTLSATSEATGQTLVVGTAVADASGAWSIATAPFVDGIYDLNATTTNTAGASASGIIRTSDTNKLVIDAGGPKVTSFRVTNAQRGTFQVGFADPYGLFESTVTSTSQYTLSRITPAPRRGQQFTVSGLTGSTTGTAPFPAVAPYGAPVLVTGTLRTGKAAGLANGTYLLTIHSAGISSIAGSPLDGEYAGRFPTGNGVAGGDFQAKFTVRNGKVSGPLPVTPATVATKAVAARAAGKHHAGAVRS